MSILRRFRVVPRAAMLLVAAAASCRSPQADALIAQQMREMGDEMNGARQDAAVMLERIDSLRAVVARQDTVLRQLAGMAGLQLPPR